MMFLEWKERATFIMTLKFLTDGVTKCDSVDLETTPRGMENIKERWCQAVPISIKSGLSRLWGLK